MHTSCRAVLLVTLAIWSMGAAASSFAQAVPAPLEEAKRLYQEADKHIDARQYKEAAEKLGRAIEIRRLALGESHPDVAQALNRLATVAYYQGDYARAEQLVQNALKIREATLARDDPSIADSLSDLAVVFQVRGDYVRPEPLYQRALTIYETVSARGAGPAAAVATSMADVLGNLGALYQRRGDFVRSESHYLRALALQESARGSDDPTVASMAANAGGMYYASGQYDKAVTLLTRAMAIQEKTLPANHPSIATSAFNLAAVLISRGDYANAQALFQRALDIDERALDPRHPRLALRLSGLADVLRMRGDYERAEPLYERVLAIREQALGSAHPQVANAWIARSLLRYARGDFSGAAEFLARGSDLREQTLALVLTSGSEDAKRQYLNEISDETDIALSLHLRSAPNSMPATMVAFNDVLQRKGRSLDAMADHMSNLRRRLEPADQAVLTELMAARSRLASLVLNGLATPAQREAAEKLQGDIQRLEQVISSRSAEYRAASRVATVREIQDALPDRAVLVEFAAYRPFDVHKPRTETFGPLRYGAYVLGKSGILASADLGEAERIDRLVEQFRRALATPGNQDVRRTGRALFDVVWQPIAKPLAGVAHTFVSPDGALNLIPFAALVDGSGKYLVESQTISYVTSGRDFARYRESSLEAGRATPPMIVADPSFGAAATPSTVPVDATSTTSQLRFERLPGTAAEATALAKVLSDAVVLTGERATEALLKQAAAPSILHIATHGFFLRPTAASTGANTRGLSIVPSPTVGTSERQDALVLSGLALAGANQRSSGPGEDGLLTALEAAGLNLWGTKMVVLSACETGVGDARNGEGVYGLRRALVLAGSQSQVMSLWQVADTATRDLMIAYYQRLRRGEGRAEALRNVQRAFVRGGSSQNHPFYWAGFIQSGDWRPAFN
jgi:CHAT domain-containing protein/Tfp pilus assembly protein PilF